MILWDRKGECLATGEAVLYWQSYTVGDSGLAVPRYLEDHAERFRSKYVAFIHDLGESLVGGKRIVDHLDMGDGFSLWWMTHLAEKSPLKSPEIYACLRLLALEEILVERRPSSLTLVSSDRDLADAVRSLCHTLKIAFVWQPQREGTERVSLRRLFRLLPTSAQALISFARHLVVHWPCRTLRDQRWSTGDDALFICSYFAHLETALCASGRFESRLWGVLPGYLRESGKRTNWLQIFLPTPDVPDVHTGIRWLQLFNSDAEHQGHHAFVGTSLTWGVVGRALKDWARMNVVRWRLRKTRDLFRPQRSAVWLWPVLRHEWRTSMNGPVAIGNCLWLALFDAALRDMPRQNVGLYLCENQGWERALLRAWRKYGHGEIIAVQHATVPFWHLYYFDDPRIVRGVGKCDMPLPDAIAVNGPSARKAFATTGYRAEQLVDVEALRYLNLSASNRKSVVRSREVNVLILGDMIAASMDHLLRLIEETTARLPAGYRFTFKPHPVYSVDLGKYPKLVAGQTTEPLHHILGEYDVAVSANSTSASVDAYLNGLRVIVAVDGGVLNLSPMRGHLGVRFVGTPDELAEALRADDQVVAGERGDGDLFFLDRELPRWRRLLAAGSRAGATLQSETA
jgi:surface carbohydrate biosynthesis protein (TIGR04326 family)